MGARRKLFAVVALGAATLAAPAQALGPQALQRALGRQEAKLGHAAGGYVVDAGADTALYAHHPGLRLSPASNEKLYTTATALLEFGAAGRVTTTVRIDPHDVTGDRGTTRAPRVDGDLDLVGSADPSLSDAGLALLADGVVAEGVREVTGGVVGDGSLLDGFRGSFDSGLRADLDIGGQLGGLVVAHGVADAKGPAHLAAVRLQALLKHRGVRFGRRARVGVAPRGATRRLASLPSPTMAELIRATNQPSDNFYAEQLLKLLGARYGTAGSTAAGAAVVRRQMASIGIRPTIVDGSGLSRTDHTSPEQVVTLLRAMRETSAAPAWLASMTVAGVNGTLVHRMRGTAAAGRCRGKTGTLRGVSSLSGYCTTAQGRTLVFSFIENGVGYSAKSVEDKMVETLARYSG